MNDFIQINPQDNVAVAVRSLAKGSIMAVASDFVCLTTDIPVAHKFALRKIGVGEAVIKYGSPIGYATQPILAGELVHTHNTKTKLDGELEYTYNPITSTERSKGEEQTFHGFLRSNGQGGTRNEIWILPTVSCTNHTASLIAKRASSLLRERRVTNIDGVYEFTHPYGCSQLGEDHKNTQKLLASLAHHPNAGGVLVLGLGCENNNIAEFRPMLGDYSPQRVKFLQSQDVEDEIKEGVRLVLELAENASKMKRVELPVSLLKIGLKCGGSDGFSGITANPLVGRISDQIVAQGGTSVLTEVPEMFGAEHILMARAKNEQVFQKIVRLINDFKDYFVSHNQPVYENPSPGNKQGGITTLEDKSLGCTEKGGTSPVVDVVDYGDRVSIPGLNLLCSPGNDLVASTALAAAGCQIVLFTTGRGTPFGTCVPTIKISTNTTLFTRKRNWMDFNAGTLVEDEDFPTATKRLMRFIVDVASGTQLTKAEQTGFREIAIWKSGVTL